MSLPSPAELVNSPGKVFILEAEPGAQRRALLGKLSAETAAQGITVHSVDADFPLRGPWAGLHEIFEALVAEISEQAPELLVRHDYELVTVLPALRERLAPRNPNLTDVSSELDQVRLYPADRAYRILHGLIDLLAEWKDRQSEVPWLVVCDAFDRSSHLVRRFFAELMRRRGATCRLALLLACDPGTTARVSEIFQPAQLGPRLRMHCETDPEKPLDPQAAGQAAERIEAQVSENPQDVERYLPSLIRLWSMSDQPARAIKWQHRALLVYGFRGFYHDSVGYGEAALANLEKDHIDDDKMRSWLVNHIVACYWACGQPERSVPLLERTLACLKSKFWRGKVRYLLAMVYARYLPEKDYERAESELEAGVRDLTEADTSSQERCFEIAFNRNGLAFIRHRQGRYTEALRLCQEAHRDLVEKLPADKHVLHKSVLIYNQAQVYAALGKLEEAASQYTAVIEHDPNYAEYYNERGNVFLKLGKLDLALADYEKSKSLSPPFSEVRVNLGHCHRLRVEFDEAVVAYSGALDLDPLQPKVLFARAQCHEELGAAEDALADYDAALRLDPRQPLVLGDRACLLFRLGQTAAALSDLNQAIDLAPATEDLYRNRAVALKDLGEYESAVADLETYLNLNATAADHEEVEQELFALRQLRRTHAPWN
jgi:tetratricopeptide (TPR) repeat protein